ncbi:hypothetical protein SERLA73DRAFT_184331 [Serpula lacrymans var. lacrymans S7.3]|uniref:Amino acid transporter transmembrane domain-containing protein n=2 Tax=Serpula lacrymans var. lacrymans TaxID=341189 RepID=F8Q310_SERL3|nr:uncharacterized protein SERLADRAFT_471968 [Serpula lacrymans var. lacrymans S7.9]EGN97571.1 hypothetical protein SERLA73DRAFT_184331 [Serpula lacrymans var. lacrymans S7.3]EGO23167.1 hypothetical protein SERLADRAFT_471968 [Serpula lacrymans var. lacrymans S7.9]
MAFVQPAAIDGGLDPRVHLSEKEQVAIIGPPLEDASPDGTVPNFETYLYYAQIQREQERNDSRPAHEVEERHWAGLFSRAIKPPPSDKASIASATDEKREPSEENAVYISKQEKRNASGALRTATWSSVFYLITTDILGPYSAPWAFAQVGYGPGVACFFVFGVMAAYGGFLLWWMFLHLDSERYPLRTFGDLAHRIFGKYARLVCNILQSLQLIFNVGLIILGNGQGLSQMAKFKLCFVVCNVVWTLAGMIFGQIRTLQKFGWIANLSIWMNIIVLIMTMGAVPHMAPNYTATVANYVAGAVEPPVQTLAIFQQAFQTQLTGIMQIVFSYGGAMIFIEFMAEMRRPWDFWKAMTVGQGFIFVVYMFFGLFVYSYQGQYTVNPANQGISAYGLQTATNAVSLTAGLIAAALYGNIGVKVIYNNIGVALFKAPPLTVPRGKMIFAISVVVYWSIAFVIGSAVPQFSNISALIAAVCIFQFSYTFPPLLMLGFTMQYDAVKGDEQFDPNNPDAACRVDSWRQLSRWRRALSSPTSLRFWFKMWNFLLTLACFACAGLSSYSAIEAIQLGFQTGSASTSFSCQSPVDKSG